MNIICFLYFDNIIKNRKCWIKIDLWKAKLEEIYISSSFVEIKKKQRSKMVKNMSVLYKKISKGRKNKKR